MVMVAAMAHLRINGSGYRKRFYSPPLRIYFCPGCIARGGVHPKDNESFGFEPGDNFLPAGLQLLGTGKGEPVAMPVKFQPH